MKFYRLKTHKQPYQFLALSTYPQTSNKDTQWSFF